MPTTLDDIRARMRAAPKPLASFSAASSNPTTAPCAWTKLLIAIAHVNGHSEPKVWAKQVTDHLAKL